MNPGTAEWLGAAARWVAYLATLVILGACGFRAGVLGTLLSAGSEVVQDADRRAARTGLWAALALLTILTVKLYAQAGSFVEPDEPITRELVTTVIGDTAWGKGWTSQMLAAGLALAGFAVAGAHRAGWLMAFVGATTVALATPLTGHAVAAERAGIWGYPLDVMHVLGSGVWLGSLAVMLIAGFTAVRRLEPASRGQRVAAMVHAFSPLALTGVTMLGLAGVILAGRYLDWSVSALWTSGYGRTLALKLLLLGGVAGTGAYNWKVLKPVLGTEAGARRITRSGLVELGLGTILLLVTAWLVHLPMPGDE